MLFRLYETNLDYQAGMNTDRKADAIDSIGLLWFIWELVFIKQHGYMVKVK